MLIQAYDFLKCHVNRLMMDGWIYGSMGTYNAFNFCYDIKSSTNIGVRVHENESDDDEHTGLSSNKLLRTFKK